MPYLDTPTRMRLDIEMDCKLGIGQWKGDHMDYVPLVLTVGSAHPQGTKSRFFRIPEMAFSSFSGVMEPFSKYPAAPSWMIFSPFFSDRLLIINTGISVVDCVCFNVRNTSTPSISGMSMSRRIMLGLQLSAAKSPVLPSQAMRTRSPKPSSTREYACAINLLSSTIKTTSLLNKGHRPHLPLKHHCKTGSVPTGPKKFRENEEGRPEGWFAALYPSTL